MAQFSLKRLFIAFTLIVIGTARIAALPEYGHGTPFWLLGGAAVGAGLLSLYKRPIVGAIAGAVMGAFIQLIIAGAMIRDVPGG